ncbi:MAG TPA: type 1 glutamine amidotransferase domain-containing protein [Casimicrobiaceae bacterium]|nr:type 1 glutamine amidotransferase domain-containing protein [Casimicrobiaceae bacterium]
MTHELNADKAPAGTATPGRLHGTRVAILATDGFEQSELLEPRRALQEAGAHTVIIAPHAGTIRAWKQGNWGDEVPVDATVSAADPEEYDALVLPGGVINPDRLRLNEQAVRFVRAMFDAEKPVGAICHGPIMLIEADVLRGGRHITSWPSLRTDVRNAGGRWSDVEVIVDEAVVTSRKPDDIPAFVRELIEVIAAAAPGSRTEVLTEG